MAVEEIILNGQKVTTLKELLRPGLKGIFVGLNPAQKSVDRGHYYQGRHGRHLWNKIREYQIVSVPLPPGEEDDAAFEQGFGFTDLVRRPAPGSEKLKLKKEEKAAVVSDLALRLSRTGDRPLIIFRYKTAWSLARAQLDRLGYRRMLWIPNPSTESGCADAMMKELQAALRASTSPDSTA